MDIWLILGLGQKIYNTKLGYLIVPESDKVLNIHTHTQWWYAKGILVPTELIAKAGTIWENKYWLITQSMKKYLWVSADINDWINKCGRRDTFLRQKSYKWWNRYSILKDINRKSLLTHCVLLLETFFLIVQKEEKREE